MQTLDQLLTKNGIGPLREGIKNKYKQYHLSDSIQFPDFEYNTNRANYEPLRTSFEHEFYVVRGIERIHPNIHVPSTNTLALIYTDDSYVPGKKILNTCRLYAESQIMTPVLAEPAGTGTRNRTAPGWLVLAGQAELFSLSLYGFFWERYPPKKASGLSINLPVSIWSTPRLSLIEGKVTNADTVWVLIKPANNPNYFVQSPIKVDARGRWRGAIIVGDTSRLNNGMKFQIRAFVNPKPTIAVGDILQKWPDAELASDLAVVVRQDEMSIPSTGDLTIYSPFDGQTVPRQVVIEGKAMHADTVWVVIRPIGNPMRWVQTPMKVGKNGRWKGVVYVGDPGDGDVGWPNQIRAFVRPVDPLKFDDVLYEWPKAERSSGMLYVIRGPKDK